MRALYLEGREARLVDRPPPDPKPGHAIVRVRLAGICNTDLELIRGYMGFSGILGHEFVGDVIDGPESWRGARVVGEINFACGQCNECTRGLGRHCPTRTVMGILGADGAFAELVRLPVANLHRVPDAMPDESAVFIEPLAAAFEILEQVRVEPGSFATVLGDGKLGLLVAQVLALAGAQVRVVGKHDGKLAILRERGIEALTLEDYRRGPNRSRTADLVVEATGSADGFSLAVEATRPRGTLVLKSTVANPAELHFAPLVIDEITVVGSRCGVFPPAIRALDGSRSIDVAPLVSATFPLTQGEDALRRAGERGVMKILLVNDERF